ncbi:MAG: dependent oxidoreductase, partial [Clostridia bacterium]|nr:dependent oxidoreductase [Clostridia bacterium]
LVMATQYPIFDGPNIYYTRLYANREYGIAVEAKRDWPDGNYINPGNPARSIRTHVEDGKKILIVVGDGHFTARSDGGMEKHYENLINFADSIAGVENLLAKWSAQDYKTPDQVPYIGRNSDNSNIYVATGYGKWGLTNGTLAGMMISDLITKGDCKHGEIYSRTRGDMMSSVGTVLSEVFGSVGELIKSKFESTESVIGLKQGEGRVVNFKGQKTGIFRDYDDTVTILDISCTHMTTELNFNDAEKTWDCPAHGGRFAIDGTLLEGPPKNCLKILFKGKLSELEVKKK